MQTSNDGNAVTSAYAVDYDMWYQYGFRAPKSIEAPFFNDPNIQCAPYAVAALLEARENILQGSVGIVGYNEYYQPGDVVYIEDRNLLFYVKAVSHSFSYGSLSTTLELNYGHSPGEYIPTMLDIVGKVLYSSKGFFDQYRSERFEMLGSAKSVGALTFVSSISTYTTPQGNDTRLPPDSDPLEVLLSGRYGERNKNILSNILLYVSGSLNQQTYQNQKPFVKIVYYRTTDSFDSDMLNFATSVKDWLINPEGDTSNGLSPIKFNTGSSSKTKPFGLNPSDIVIEQVDFTDPANQTRLQVFPDTGADSVANTQGPSSAAVYAARSCSMSTLSPENFRVFLANTVIDVFIDSKPIPVLSADSVGTARAAAAASSGAGAGAGNAAGAVQSSSSSASAATAASAAGAARNAAGGG